MSTEHSDSDAGDGQPHKRVTDEEGTVDKKVKNRILKARERVDDREDQLFVQAPATADVHITKEDAVTAWATSVRQYIRVVKPLLTSDKVEGSEYYFHEVALGGFEIPPPDGKREWSRFAYTDDPNALTREMGLPVSFDPPKAKVASFNGVKDVLDRHRISKRWTIDMNPDSILPGEDVDTLSVDMAVPKPILEDAIEATDGFLQQAGIGLEIGHQQTDESDEEPF